MSEPVAEQASSGPLSDLVATLRLSGADAQTDRDVFTGKSQPMPSGRVYGGQVLAQSVIAASHTVQQERVVHSMHGYFLRPGDAAADIAFAVDRIHDGRSFSQRRVQAYQEGVPILSMIASFQDDHPGLEHQERMPEGVPDPEELPDVETALAARHPSSASLFTSRPVELRHFPSDLYLAVDEPAPTQMVWMRTRGRLPDDPGIHRAALAYLSDLTIQEPVLRAHGVPWATPGLKMASLDHAMWWHRYGRADEWLLYVQASPSARGGRGLSLGRIHSRDGALLATVGQEIMARVPAPAAATRPAAAAG